MENINFLRDASYRFIENRFLLPEFDMSFLNDKYTDVTLWKKEICNYLKKMLLYSPPSVPFNEEIVEEKELGEYIRQKVYFYSAPGCRIPAYILIPKGLREPAPAVVVLHDHSAQFYWGKEKCVECTDANPVLKSLIDNTYSGLPVASELAKRGYVTLVIDSLFFGERKYDLIKNDTYRKRLEKFEFESVEYIREYNSIEFEIEPELVRMIYHAGYTFMGIRMWDDIASVSYLCSRPEVDPQRIGCLGLSMGGHRSGWLSAMDDRIKCAAVICWMARYKEMVEHRLTNVPWMWAVPGLFDKLDYPDVVSLSVPKPLLVIHGLLDSLFPEETAQKAGEVIQKVYDKAGVGDKFTWLTFNGPHEFNKEMQGKTYKWMDKILKNDARSDE